MVEMHEYGNTQFPTILLLHAFGMHWSMWQGVIDELKADYHLLIPSLEGHEDAHRTVFTTVEHNALSLADWLCQNGYQQIYAAIGVSLGGAVTAKLLSLKTMHISFAIIDAGIIPVGLNQVQEFFEVSSNLFMFFAAHNLHLIKLLELYDQYTQKQMVNFNKMIKTITWKTAKNVFYGVDTYTIPNCSSDVTTKIAYWYGLLEEKERKAAGERLKQFFSNVTLKSFDGYNHAQMCLAKPNIYVENIRKFIASNNIQASC